MKVYVIDGYNVVRSVERYNEVAARDIDAARARVVGDVASYVHGEADAVIVFDGAANPNSDGSLHDVAGVSVVFSPYGLEADSVIEQIVAQRAAQGHEVILVTSDAQTQWVALGHGALRVSSAEFGSRIGDMIVESGEHNPTGSSRHAVDERIDPAIRDTLARWARGQ